MKILLCFGTRPEAIKMAPLYFELSKNKKFETKICVTAQHRGMLDQVLGFFGIVPDFDLDIMQPNQTLNQITSKIIAGIDPVLEAFQPNVVLVHGDTTTSFAVAMAAFHRHIKVGHVEAGLRTYNKNSPFPEEMNRQLTTRIADYHFAPTTLAKQNLLRDGVHKNNIAVTGNTVVDALFLGLQKIENGYESQDLKLVKSVIDLEKKIILITGHRRENFGDGFKNLCHALLEIAKQDGVQIVFPVHLNPQVKTIVTEMLGNTSNIILLPPVDYPGFIYLMQQSYIILTDSGGVQEEAPSLGKPVLVMRQNSERPEGINSGAAKLVGMEIEKIVAETKLLLNDQQQYLKMSAIQNPYGSGMAAQNIVKYLENISL